MKHQERILISPLNWGIGHATRLAPIINNYKSSGHKVILAGTGISLEFLKNEFPDLEYVILGGFTGRYAKKPFFMLFLLIQMPLFLISIFTERYKLAKIIRQYRITTVISDNRYGLINRKVKCILITHQIFIKLPPILAPVEPVLHHITRHIIQQFNECWIPDYENYSESLAGQLCHGKKMPNNIKYIGPLSRFKNLNLIDNPIVVEDFETLILISGPEPYRTQFEKEMENRFRNSAQKVLMVCGKPGSNNQSELFGNLQKVNHLKTPELYFYLTRVNKIIARSGYSTIMDLHLLGLSGELIPTPGQTEQEYLAGWNKKSNKKAI